MENSLETMWTLDQVADHCSASSCWVIIQDYVYDVTNFLSDHPGGANAILRYAGTDATAAYRPIHPPDTLSKNLQSWQHLGRLDPTSSRTLVNRKSERPKTRDELRMQAGQLRKPPLARILNLRQMEEVAKEILSHKAYSYYSAGSDDEITLSQNALAFRNFFFQTRVMRAVGSCNPSTKILGFPSALPIFVSGAAMACLGHPLGEKNITRGAGHTGIIQMVSSNASLSYAEIAQSRQSLKQPLFFQLYKNKSDIVAERRIREVEALGYKAIFLTVDAVVTSNRERDIRSQWESEDQRHSIHSYHDENSRDDNLEPRSIDILGTSGAMVSSDDRNMTWEKTIPWLRRVTDLPIVIKGIQCVADAVLAVEAGVDGILISNHGGRQMEYSLPSIEVLYQLRRDRPDVFDKTEVYMDGGIRRGTDVLKALCLGATAVGLGRPFLYAQSAYGAAGVVKIVRILEHEIMTGMRLLGAKTVHDLVPEMIERLDMRCAKL